MIDQVLVMCAALAANLLLVVLLVLAVIGLCWLLTNVTRRVSRTVSTVTARWRVIARGWWTVAELWWVAAEVRAQRRRVR